MCKTEQLRREDGLCTARLHHGPGHQSSTFCNLKGKHTVHQTRYGRDEQVSQWRGKHGFTGYFDDPKEVKV